MPRNHRLKTAAAAVPQTRDEADRLLGEIGFLSRQIETLEAAQTDAIARIKASTKAQTGPLAEQRKAKFEALTAWAEANRSQLLKGDTRSVSLSQGAIGWRWGNPTVKVKRGMEDIVIAALKAARLKRLLRVRTELDKEAIAREPGAVAGIDGIAVEQVESFWAKPLDVKSEEKKDLHKIAAEAVIEHTAA